MKLSAAVLVGVAGVLSAGFCAFAVAQTQTHQATIYHCGPDGKELRNTPCPDQPNAAPSTLNFDSPSAADTAEARARTKAEQAAADQADRERLAEEERQRHDGAKPATKPASAASSTQLIVLRPPRPWPPKPPHHSASNAVR